ncbi:MAG: radical SAM protein [Thermoleophilia bacterium]|nr:radical SAM protein [Thermoleophilia bacterium]
MLFSPNQEQGSSRGEPSSWPSYLALHESGELARRAERAWKRLRRCVLCPRRCRVNRLNGELGACGVGPLAQVASYGPHYGEEAPLVGRGGSGTIFFAGCNLACVFCQNHDISQPNVGHAVRARIWEKSSAELAAIMLELQVLGCENVNLVSPSHVVPQIIAALDIAAGKGLHLPVVYNTGGYDSLGTLRLLDGVIDIYMPDMKYADESVAARLSGVGDYVRRNLAAVREMHRQVGDLRLDERGVARRGLLVRHLVLPEGLAGTAEVMEFIATEISRSTYINVMDQYRPAHKAFLYPEIARPITRQEYKQAVSDALRRGLSRLDPG